VVDAVNGEAEESSRKRRCCIVGFGGSGGVFLVDEVKGEEHGVRAGDGVHEQAIAALLDAHF
jgi:hypothetical protein